jgi:hypothetical protein
MHHMTGSEYQHSTPVPNTRAEVRKTDCGLSVLGGIHASARGGFAAGGAQRLREQPHVVHMHMTVRR